MSESNRVRESVENGLLAHRVPELSIFVQRCGLELAMAPVVTFLCLIILQVRSDSRADLLLHCKNLRLELSLFNPNLFFSLLFRQVKKSENGLKLRLLWKSGIYYKIYPYNNNVTLPAEPYFPPLNAQKRFIIEFSSSEKKLTHFMCNKMFSFALRVKAHTALVDLLTYSLKSRSNVLQFLAQAPFSS